MLCHQYAGGVLDKRQAAKVTPSAAPCESRLASSENHGTSFFFRFFFWKWIGSGCCQGRLSQGTDYANGGHGRWRAVCSQGKRRPQAKSVSRVRTPVFISLPNRYSLSPKIITTIEFKIYLTKEYNFDLPTTKDKIIFEIFSQKTTNTSFAHCKRQRVF